MNELPVADCGGRAWEPGRRLGARGVRLVIVHAAAWADDAIRTGASLKLRVRVAKLTTSKPVEGLENAVLIRHVELQRAFG